MPFDGSGNFTRSFPAGGWQGDAAAGIKILASRHDTHDADLAAGLSNVICKDGQSSPTANIPFNGKRITNLANPVDPQDAATKAFADGKVAKAGDTMTGGLTLAPSSGDTELFLKKATVSTNISLKGLSETGLQRWAVVPGVNSAAADFAIARYNDAGTYLDAPLAIERATGIVAMPQAPKMPSGFHAINSGNKLLFNWIAGALSVDIDGTTGQKRVWTDHTSTFVGAQNGYCKFSNGLLMQWGLAAPGADQFINFPTAFVNVFSIVCTGVGTLAATSTLIASVDGISGTSFLMRPRFANNGGTVGVATQSFFWFATGTAP